MSHKVRFFSRTALMALAVILVTLIGYADTRVAGAVDAQSNGNASDHALMLFPTNTKRPSPTDVPPIAATDVPPASATDIPLTATDVPPTATDVQSTVLSTVQPSVQPTDQSTAQTTNLTVTPAATNKLPSVPSRSDCTSKPQATAIPSPVARLKAPNNDILNIALLGTDADVDPTDPSFRTDSIVIVSINRTTNTVAMLSIPRDLIVCIPQLGMQRVNVAYNWGNEVKWQPGGGFGLFQETILYNFGIPVHYYAKVSLLGFKQIVDTLNGVDLAVDCPIRNELRFEGNDSQGTPVYKPESMEIGYYHMGGSLALWYARSRHNTSDFDRNRRQQQLLRAIYHTARQQGLIQKAPELWGQLTKVVDTNLQLVDVLGLVPLALSLNPDDISTYYMVKGAQTQHWTTPQNEDVQVPLEPGMSDMIRNFYTPPVKNKIKQEDSTVDIINGTANDNWDKVAEDTLLSRGFVAQAKGKGDPTPQTTVYDYTGGAKPISLGGLLKALNIKSTQVVSQPDPNRTTDFRVVLGDNYNSCTAAGFAGVPTKQ